MRNVRDLKPKSPVIVVKCVNVTVYGVGVDIGCRMALSVFDLPASYLDSHRAHLEKILLKNTSFGAGRGFSKQERADHAVLDNPLFSEDTLIRSLKDKAWEQLGSLPAEEIISRSSV